MAEVEEWRPVVGWENSYEVSSLGRVRSRAGLKKLATTRFGYARVNFQEGGRRTRRRAAPLVHCIVAEAFLGPRPHGHDVAHFNGDKLDNRLGNLRYATRSENEADKRRHGRLAVGEERPNAKIRTEVAAAIKAAEGSQRDIAARFGVRQQDVSAIKTGRRWKHV